MWRIDDVRSKSNERGASLVEYALLLAMLVIIALASIRAIGMSVSARFSGVSSELTQ